MIGVKIKIQDLENKDNVLFPELNKHEVHHHGPLTHVSILEGGMTSGKTSLIFSGETEDGKVVNLEVSAEMLESINSMTRGARQRWGEIPND